MLHLATGGMCRYEKFSLPQSLLSAEVAGLNLEEVIGKPDTQEKCRRHDQASCTVTHTQKQKHTQQKHTDTRTMYVVHKNTHMVKLLVTKASCFQHSTTHQHLITWSAQEAFRYIRNLQYDRNNLIA